MAAFFNENASVGAARGASPLPSLPAPANDAATPSEVDNIADNAMVETILFMEFSQKQQESRTQPVNSGQIVVAGKNCRERFVVQPGAGIPARIAAGILPKIRGKESGLWPVPANMVSAMAKM